MTNSQKNWALVLSGGGARGIAHLGLIKALEELGFQPRSISGTSAGALIGAFYSAGLTVDEICKIIVDNKFFRWYDFAFSSKGLLKVKSNEKMLSKYLGDRSFKSLRIPLTVSAVDIQGGEVVRIDSGDVVSAVLASSAIPVLFEPVMRKGKLLIDGSAGEVLPVEPVVGKAEVVIGSYVNPIQKSKKKINMMEIFDKGFHMALHHELENKRKYFDLLLEPPALSQYSMFDLDKSKAILKIGYDFAMQHREKILQLLK